MTIRLYNTLTRQKSDLMTVEPGRVGIYLCGPTVYKESHIGHMVGPVIFDTIKRYLVYSGYKVQLVVNITDVDDKLIAESRKRDIPMAAIAEEMTQDYLRNLKSLGVTGIDVMPRATEHMGGIIAFVKDLIAKGKAYAADGDVFFDVTRDGDYGKLSNRTAESQQGEGGEAAGKKRSPGDFALWKAAKADEPAWDSPWGPGRPGWHIECSAMSHAILGQTFDIHGGGLDLLFPHHENELAQSESRFDRPMVNYWMHNGLMRASTAAGKVGGRSDRDGESPPTDDAGGGKISRSKGAGGLAKLIDKHGGETLRFFLLRTHYRSTIVFDEKELDDSRAALEGFYRLFERVERITGKSYWDVPVAATRAEGDARPVGGAGLAGKAGSTLPAEAANIRSRFLERMDDDFNTGGATSELFELVRLLNRHADQHKLEDAAARDATEVDAFTSAVAVLRELANLLGLFADRPKSAAAGDGALTGSLIDLILELRQQARQRKDFATSDQIRDTLSRLGVVLEDRKGGTGWRIEAPPVS